MIQKSSSTDSKKSSLESDTPHKKDLSQIIDSRFGRSSTVIASQLPVTAWYELIGESTIADALLDRLVHSSHRIDLKGESKRKGMIETIQ